MGEVMGLADYISSFGQHFFLFRPNNYYKLSLRVTFSKPFDNLKSICPVAYIL